MPGLKMGKSSKMSRAWRGCAGGASNDAGSSINGNSESVDSHPTPQTGGGGGGFFGK